MSPTAALHSPVFLTYLAVVTSMLLGAGALLLALRSIHSEAVERARRSYRGWLIIVPVLFLALFLGRAATIVFFTVVAIFGFKEFARATGLYTDWWMTAAVYLGIIASGLTALMPDPGGAGPDWYSLYLTLPIYAISVLMVIPIVRDRAQGQLQSLALAIVGFLYFGWMFEHMAFLANARHAYHDLFYILTAVGVNDIAEYVSGATLGRRPLRPHINPRKTWEGAIGALAVSMALPWALRPTLPHLQWWELLLVGAVVGIGGQLGDLAVGVIRRDLGVEGMGSAIPGQRGILDRSDSLIYVAPLFFQIVRHSQDVY